MGKSKILTGTPWHIEKFVRKEGDPKRDKRKCTYYFQECNYCLMNHVHCMGSAHCTCYKVIEKPKEEKIEQKIIEKKKEKVAVSFKGIKEIPMDMVKIPSDFAKPSNDKIEKIKHFYIKHGEFDKPILVSCDGLKYKLEDQYVRYYVAKQFGLTTISARMNTAENIFENKIERVGKRIKHKTFGFGTVKEVSGQYVTIGFDSGKEIKLDLDICVEKGVISII